MDNVDFSTKDLYLSAALLSLGASLINIDRTDPKHMEFQFVSDSSLDLKSIELEWTNKTLECNAASFAEAIRRMKALVHSRQSSDTHY